VGHVLARMLNNAVVPDAVVDQLYPDEEEAA
jgi:hypothetical protein